MTAHTYWSASILAALLLATALPTTAAAQNSSLLHARSAGATASPSSQSSRSLSPTASGATGRAGELSGALRRFAGPEPVAESPAEPRDAPRPDWPGPASEAPRQPLSLRGVSWTRPPAPALRSFKINDIVTIRVDEMSRMMAEGEAESRKQNSFEAILSDWIKLSDGRLRPDPQANGDPTVANESNSRLRNEASIESRESITFNIAARVVDIRPNGNLVLEARKTYRVNDNQWETSLTGICRAKDIAADNVVLSRDMIDLQIIKQDQGQVRDGYRRGWFTRLLDRVQPF